MKILTQEELRAIKKTKTLIIYGCGLSINDLTPEDKRYLQICDSLSFNWFCNSNIPTTYYMIREQANIPKRIAEGQELSDLIRMLTSPTYIESCLIIHDVSQHSPHALHYPDIIKDIFPNNKGIIVKDIKGGNANNFKDDIFEVGIQHGLCSLTNALHFAIWMGYQRLLFVGIDLYNTKYFWLGNAKRHGVKSPKQKHPIANATLSILKQTLEIMKIKNPKFRMAVYDQRSLLSEIMPVRKRL